MKNLILVLLALFFTLETFSQTIYKREKNFNFGDGSGNRVINFDRNPDGDTVSLTADTALFRLVINKDIYGQGNLLIDGASQFNSPLTLAADLLMTGTGALDLPVGTDLQRPISPNSGMIRFNSDSVSFEGYDGSAWGSLGGGLGAPEIYFVYDFEGAVDAADFTCDANLSVANDTTTPLWGNKSIILLQGATPPSVGAKCVGPNIAVPLGARGKRHIVKIPVVNGHNADEIAVNIYDVTNSVELGQAPLSVSSEAKYQQLIFQTNSTTENIRVEYEVLVQNASATAEFDNIYGQDRLDPVDIYASSEPVAYTPSSSAGFGTLAATNLKWARSGSYLLLTGNFTTGTVAASTANIALPNGLTIANGTPRVVGSYFRSTSSNTHGGAVLATAGDSFLEFSTNGVFGGDTVSAVSAANGDTIATTGGVVHFSSVAIPIAGWADKENFVAIKGFTANDISNTNDGFTFIADSSGVVSNEPDGLNWISGNGTIPTTGTYTYTVADGTFSSAPNCQVVEQDIGSTGNACYKDSRTTANEIWVSCYQRISGAAVNQAHSVSCSKSGDRIKESERVVLFKEGLYAPKCYLSDQKGNGTSGGSVSAGSYSARVLNSAVGDCSFLSLANGTTGTDGTANVINLPSGEYQVECSAPCFMCSDHRIKMVLDPLGTPSNAAFGTSEYSRSASDASQTRSTMRTSFPLTSQTQIQLQHFASAAGGGASGFGVATAAPDGEVYSECSITKLK